jgi:hypothetical protein
MGHLNGGMLFLFRSENINELLERLYPPRKPEKGKKYLYLDIQDIQTCLVGWGIDSKSTNQY